jgi:hypothetical protein
MLATTVLGRLATTNDDALYFLKEQISTDENWRVQEMPAKAFDCTLSNKSAQRT